MLRDEGILRHLNSQDQSPSYRNTSSTDMGLTNDNVVESVRRDFTQICDEVPLQLIGRWWCIRRHNDVIMLSSAALQRGWNHRCSAL